jgi:RNA polymerase sigma-70 factor (ECF subfamily)
LRRLLDEALAVLPEAHRQAFVLHNDGELPYREVAQIQGVPIGTVMSRLYYARRKLQAYLFGRAVS